MPKASPQLVNRDREMIPRMLVRAMFILALCTVVLVGYATITDRPLVGQPIPSPVEKERIISIERAGGQFTVRDEAGAVLAEMDANRAGFIAVVYAGLARNRMQHKLPASDPLRLASHENGRLSLHDDATGWHVELASFGASNRAAFAKLLN